MKNKNFEMGTVSKAKQENVVSVGKYVPKLIPVKDEGRIFFYGTEDYIPKERDIVGKAWTRYFDSKLNKYGLVTSIAGLSYFFRLSGRDDENTCSLSFKTLEYEYATTELDAHATKELFETVANFLETVYKESGGKFIEIDISPADASYSTLEIDDCISKIMKHTNTFTQKELQEEYKGFRIFDLYQKIFGENYHEVHYNFNSRSSGRSRYFRLQFRKYLQNWKIEEVEGSDRFRLTRVDKD
jgi:hypothetical protein